MTLLEIATLAATRFGLTDENEIRLAKTLANARCRMIWEDQLWRDSLCSFAFTFDPATNGQTLTDNSVLAAQGLVLLPSVVDRVVALRRTDAEVPFSDEQQLFQADLDGFVQTGTPTQFQILPRCCGFNPRPTTVLSLAGSAPDHGHQVTATWVTGQHRRCAKEFTLGTTPTPMTATGYENEGLAQVLSVVKPVTSDAVTVLSGSVPVAWLQPDETELEPRVGLRVLPVPAAVTHFRVLVKVEAAPLVQDHDTTGLRGGDNCLVAFVLADLLQEGRQFAKAQLVTQEAMALLDQLKRVETVQEAFRPRLVPAEAGGNPEWDWSTGKAAF